MEQKKPGRKPRFEGKRTQVNYYLPDTLLADAKQYAAERGMSFTDLAAAALAEKIGSTYDAQEALPLKPTA